MAEGARIAAQNAGKPDLPITGIDALPIESGGMKAVSAGRLSATWMYRPAGRKRSTRRSRSCSTVSRRPRRKLCPPG